MPTLISLQVGRPQALGVPGSREPMDKPWVSGFFKDPVTTPVTLSSFNLDGDEQADLENHGGRDKAICCYAAEHYPSWHTALELPDLPYGAFGENFTLEGLNEDTICLGDQYTIGTATVEVSQPRQPCWKLGRRWRIKELPAVVIESGRTGWYLRVLQPGTVAAGQELTLIARPLPEWSIARANEIFYRGKHDADASEALGSVELLAESWREHLLSRATMLRAKK
jgi:MOSC domain-containing protein YiiM